MSKEQAAPQLRPAGSPEAAFGTRSCLRLPQLPSAASAALARSRSTRRVFHIGALVIAGFASLIIAAFASLFGVVIAFFAVTA